MYTWNWVNNTFSTITFTRFCLLLCHCQWHYEEKHSEVAIIRHRFQHVAKTVGGNPNFIYYPLWPLTRFGLSPLVNDHQPTYITNLRGKKSHWYPSSAHACVLANFCHLVTQKKKPSATHTKRFLLKKVVSNSPNFEDLFFEIAHI
jgi:hypothetical protein